MEVTCFVISAHSGATETSSTMLTNSEKGNDHEADEEGEIDYWAVVVSTSRYFFNYRHTANALTMYHLLRRFGLDDDHIILFLGDSYACDPRNPYPGAIYNNANNHDDDDDYITYGSDE
uniref:Putative GPI-anchor transamidase n=1 Tax=Lygus hesperus TaxID=30085 RepID=A0A0A9Z9X4_LYGHE